jgi:hypothetical protein
MTEKRRLPAGKKFFAKLRMTGNEDDEETVTKQGMPAPAAG